MVDYALIMALEMHSKQNKLNLVMVMYQREYLIVVDIINKIQVNSN